jgi:hypothetical protein
VHAVNFPEAAPVLLRHAGGRPGQALADVHPLRRPSLLFQVSGPVLLRLLLHRLGCTQRLTGLLLLLLLLLLL